MHHHEQRHLEIVGVVDADLGAVEDAGVGILHVADVDAYAVALDARACAAERVFERKVDLGHAVDIMPRVPVAALTLLAATVAVAAIAGGCATAPAVALERAQAEAQAGHAARALER